MINTQTYSQKKHSTGDAAVSGLFNGLLGGCAMALVIVGFSLAAGQGAAYLGNFSSEAPAPPFQGLLMHLAVSGIYGLLFGLIRNWTLLSWLKRLPGWLVGLGYALVLWVLAVTVLLPAARSLILAMPWVVFFTGHVAYGLVLGLRQKP
jgi:hypothetical protein